MEIPNNVTDAFRIFKGRNKTELPPLNKIQEALLTAWEVYLYEETDSGNLMASAGDFDAIWRRTL